MPQPRDDAGRDHSRTTEVGGVDTLKQAAVQFLQLVIAGRIDEAYQRYADATGKHHNPFFGGLSALRKAMTENHLQFPNKKLTARNVLCDDNWWLCIRTYC